MGVVEGVGAYVFVCGFLVAIMGCYNKNSAPQNLLLTATMISITKRKTVAMAMAAQKRTTSDTGWMRKVKGHDMRLQLRLLRVFVAIVLGTLRIPNATMAITTGPLTTNMAAEITNEALEIIKPAEIITETAAAGVETTTATSTTTIMLTNTIETMSQNASVNSSKESSPSTAASANVTSGLLAPTTATTDLAVRRRHQHQLQLPHLNATTLLSTTTINMTSSEVDDIDLIEAPELNATFHQYCLAHRNSFADLFTIILYSIVCIVGLFGNTLVIYVVLRFSKMQTVTNIYILNLAIADECFLIGIPFLLYTMRICSWTFGEYMCKAYMVSTSITQFTSSIFLLIMSADRFIAVCHPIASPRYRTLHIAKMVSAVAWLTSAVLMLPVILFASTIAQEDGLHYSCNIEWPETYKKHSGTTFILYTFFLGFATPLCFILCFYYLVIKKLHAVGRKHKSKEKKRSHRKVTRLVLTVITVYILCWLPHWISQVALINSSPDQRDLSRFEILIFLLLGCLAYSNSAMNPILYAFLSDNFRKSFFKAFTCMAGHEVNAQLQVEPSVFTKHGGSRRRGSKRLISQAVPKTKATLHPTPAGNNNSSTTTSSTTAQADKSTVAVAMSMGTGTGVGPTTTTSTLNALAQFGDAPGTSLYPTTNGRINAENVLLILDKEKAVYATVLERGTPNQFKGGNTLQTDL